MWVFQHDHDSPTRPKRPIIRRIITTRESRQRNLFWRAGLNINADNAWHFKLSSLDLFKPTPVHRQLGMPTNCYRRMCEVTSLQFFESTMLNPAKLH